VIDPGHGGADEGARGPGGAKEKDITLQMARRVKAAIESRIGLRVLLTRDTDEAVALDRRASVANNNKADLFFSLHVNAAIRSETRGADVLSLSVTDYQARSGVGETRDLPVPVAGGGTRSVDFVPWDLAQLPFAQKSAALASVLVRQLGARGVTLHAIEAARLPLRPLVGANMPAVLVEMGFLTNAADEKALAGAELSGDIVDAIVSTIDEVRRGGFPGSGGR
jgi:N-acetylmuramoyl-L-alanine amidase